MSLMFLPLIPSLNSLNLFRSPSLRCFAYRWNIAYLDNRSGNSNLTDKSIRDNIAGSRSCFLFVAQISSTFVLLSNESIFRSSVDRILLLASCISPSRDCAKASISSMKMMTLPSFWQLSHTSAKRFSLSPYHFDIIASIGIYTNGIRT